MLLKYFACGSSMCTKKLKKRVPSATVYGRARLPKHKLCFHKKSKGCSAKCDAHFTGDDGDCVRGVVFEICSCDKPRLDRAEGLGKGYSEKHVVVECDSGAVTAATYVAQENAIVTSAHVLRPSSAPLPFSQATRTTRCCASKYTLCDIFAPRKRRRAREGREGEEAPRTPAHLRQVTGRSTIRTL
jgi:hypothetical protein